MAALQAYHKSLDYSYAPGMFPTMEALTKRPQWVRRVLVHSRLSDENRQRLEQLCQKEGIRMEEADRALLRLSSKDNCFAAAVFDKTDGALDPAQSHVLLYQPMDKGNLGTIMRTALGFHFVNLALIPPMADRFDPAVTRASMGALFSMNVAVFESIAAYRAAFPDHQLYPFMLQASKPLDEVLKNAAFPATLLFGNEGAGLPAACADMGQATIIPHSGAIDSLNLAVAAGIGMHAFARAQEEAL